MGLGGELPRPIHDVLNTAKNVVETCIRNPLHRAHRHMQEAPAIYYLAVGLISFETPEGAYNSCNSCNSCTELYREHVCECSLLTAHTSRDRDWDSETVKSYKDRVRACVSRRGSRGHLDKI